MRKKSENVRARRLNVKYETRNGNSVRPKRRNAIVKKKSGMPKGNANDSDGRANGGRMRLASMRNANAAVWWTKRDSCGETNRTLSHALEACLPM